MFLSLPLYFHYPHIGQHTFTEASEEFLQNTRTQVSFLKVYNLERGIWYTARDRNMNDFERRIHRIL